MNAIIDSAMRADYVIGSGAVPGGAGGGFSPGLERSLSALPQVSTATGIRSGVAQIYGKTATVTATDPSKAAALFNIGVLHGRLASMTASGIAVSSQVAASHQLRIGSPVSLTFPATGRKTYHVQVIYKVRELAGDYVLPLAAATANFPQALDSPDLREARTRGDGEHGPSRDRPRPRRLPERNAHRPGPVQGTAGAAGEPAAQPGLRAARPGPDHRVHRHRQHPGPVELRADTGTRAAAGGRHDPGAAALGRCAWSPSSSPCSVPSRAWSSGLCSAGPSSPRCARRGSPTWCSR